MLDPDGALVEPLRLKDEPDAADSRPGPSTETFAFEDFLLSKGKKASSAFEVPTSMSSTDFEILEDWVRFQLKSLRAHLGVEDPAPSNDDKKGTVAEFKRRLRKTDR